MCGPEPHAAECLASAIPVPVAVVDFDGRIARVNRAAAQLLGYSQEELEGRLYGEFLPAEEREARMAELGRLARAGGSASYEGRFRNKDGSCRWFKWISVVMPNEKLIYSVARDITEQKKSEAASRDSEAWLIFTLDAAGVGLRYRENGQTHATDRQFRLYGLEPAGQWVSHERWLALIHPDDRNALEAEQRLARQRGVPYDIQFRVFWPDGSLHWLQCRGAVFGSGDAERKMETTVDVTERKRAEATLESFFALSSLAVAIVGYDGSIKFLNRAVLQRSGFEIEDVRNRPLLDLIHPDDRVLVHAELQRLLAGSGDIAFECRGMTKDRAVYWMLIAATALPDENSIIAVAHDVTERKLAQETLRRSQAELEIHAQRLARSNEELERFAFVASHDLQEPLRMVASFTQLLASRYAGRLDETADRYINYAVDGAKRMQQLIVDLLSYSRVNSQELDLQPIEFDAPVRTAVRNLETSIKESGGSVQWDCLPTLSADQTQIAQLFQNLICNAIKFRRKGERPHIRISSADNGAEFVFSVQDNGIGIDPEQKERIFELFQRLHTRADYPGTGIGLAVCKKVVERHGGRIWVESQPRAGSTFRFTLPKTQNTE